MFEIEMMSVEGFKAAIILSLVVSVAKHQRPEVFGVILAFKFEDFSLDAQTHRLCASERLISLQKPQNDSSFQLQISGTRPQTSSSTWQQSLKHQSILWELTTNQIRARNNS